MEDLKEKLVVTFSSSETTTEAQALQLLSRFTKPEYFRNSDEQLFRCACRNGWTVVLRALMELYDHDPDCQSLLDPLLLQASVNGHLDIVRYLVTEQHCDPMCENWYGKTPLQVACTNGHLDVVRYLVTDQYCDPVYENYYGQTPLHEACKNGHLDIVKYLLTEQHCDPMCKNHDGRTLLHEACENGHLDIVKYLVTEQHCDPMCMSHDDRTLLHEACENGYLDIVMYLVAEQHCDPLCKNRDGGTPLGEACENGHLDVVKYLVTEQNCDPMCKNHDGRTLLHQACESGHLDIVKYLVTEQHCDPMCKNHDGKTLLHQACENEHLDIVKYLVTEQHCDPVCKNHDGRTLLHQACESGHLYIVKYLVTEQHCDPLCKNHDGRTPLHEACGNGHLDIVKYLATTCQCNPLPADKNGETPYSIALSKHHEGVTAFLDSIGRIYVDPRVQDIISIFTSRLADEAHTLVLLSRFPQKSVIKDIRNERARSETLLHCACWNGWYKVVRVLVERYQCDPKCQDKLGSTPLHSACDTAQLDIVKYLITQHGCDPLQRDMCGVSALDTASHSGYVDIVAFFFSITSYEVLESITSGYSSIHPFKPTLKVFVLGNPSAGKSTLVKAIQNRLTSKTIFGTFTDYFRRVSGVELCTAGIIPVPIESQKGSIILYDFAGQYQYYSSHAALLESLVSSSGSLILMVVDLSKSKEEITRTLHYWNCFIESHCRKEDVHEKPEVFIVGSHVDIVKSQGGNQKVSDILSDLNSLQFVNQVFTLNCTLLVSNGLKKICDAISESCTRIQDMFDLDMQVHLLHTLIYMKFSSYSACRVSSIMTYVYERLRTQSRTGFIKLLPADILVVSQHLTTLNNRGQFLYLKNDRWIEDGWVILDKKVLLSEINGTIFAHHHNIASSTGIVPFSKIVEEFPTHDPEMIVSFLTHLEFCQQIDKSEACLISTEASQGHPPPFYFFPALVSEDRPTESGRTTEQTHYKCGWVMCCSRPDQFLSPRFLHVLLLRLAFSFALAVEPADEDRTCPVLQRKCNVWKSGIHWQNRDAVEAVVEVVEQSTAVTVVMGCMEGSEIACMRVRSKLIRTILATKDRFCGTVEVRESLVHPAELGSYPLRSPHLLTLFTVTELATAIAEGKPAVTHKQGQRQEMLTIENLLHFEPYAGLNRAILSKLFGNDNDQEEAPDDFLMDMAKAAHTSIDVFKTILDYNESELQVAIGELVPPYQNSSIHHCYLLFRTWKVCNGHPANTYKALREALDEYTVFCGRNPLAITQASSSPP